MPWKDCALPVDSDSALQLWVDFSTLTGNQGDDVYSFTNLAAMYNLTISRSVQVLNLKLNH